MLYAQENIDVIPGKWKEYVEALEEKQIPLYHDMGYRLTACWETVASQGYWPEAVTLWELDDYMHYAAVLRAQYSDGRLSKRFREWQAHLATLTTRTQGRIMLPSSKTPTLAQIKAGGRDAKICVHETVRTTPRKAKVYAENCQRLWEPVASRHGRWMVGVYSVAWRNTEAINIWALEDWETIGRHQAEIMKDEGAQSWTEIAISLRQDWYDRILHALPCSPI